MNEQRDREKDEHYQLRLVARIVDLEKQLEVLQRARLTNVSDVMRENEALRKDAERYRWLRDNCSWTVLKEILTPLSTRQ